MMNSLSYRSKVDLAVKHYSSLFRLPTLKRTLALSFLASLSLGVIMKLVHKFTPSIDQILEGILFGVILFGATLLVDYLSAKIFHKKDIILSSFRRLSFLSFLINLLFAVFTGIFCVLMLLYPCSVMSIKMFSFCFFIALSFRLIVTSAISFSNIFFKLASSIIQPSTTLLLLTLFQGERLRLLVPLSYFTLSFTLSFVNVSLFLALLNKDGVRRLGVPSLKIFRAFLANWTEDYEIPFEEILEQISEKRDITVSMLVFRGKNREDLKAIIVVPNIHPGPFKNVGSSILPSLIKDSVEKEYGCIVSVPHGISGHELDLPSQQENMKVIDGIINALKEPKIFSDRATKFFILERDGAKVGCQIFNDCAFLTLTISPETMEDLPLELNEIIIQKAIKEGFSWAIPVDAHNSIDGSFNIKRAMNLLKDAACLALERAKNLECFQGSMMVGAGHVAPGGLGPKEGIGPGGITAIIVCVGNQKTAYITIDGNNMVSGLREKILSKLIDLGVECGEVFTTDTHAVNAIVLTRRGYHPIGEVIDHSELAKYVKCAVSEALKNVEPAEVAWYKVVIPDVKVIGERKIGELSELTDEVSRKAKRYSISFVFFSFLLTLFFLLI